MSARVLHEWLDTGMATAVRLQIVETGQLRLHPVGEAVLMTDDTRRTVGYAVKEILRLAAENAELRALLVEARDAIASLPDDALGAASAPETSPDGEAGLMTWPIRDELLDHLNRALRGGESDGE